MPFLLWQIWGLIAPALAVMLPLFAYVLGARLAMIHAGLGMAGAIVVLEALLLGYRKVPFACTYVPSENLKALAPIYLIAFLIGAFSFASLERTALQNADALKLASVLIVVFALLRAAASRHRPVLPVDFNEAPSTTQRLGLHT